MSSSRSSARRHGHRSSTPRAGSSTRSLRASAAGRTRSVRLRRGRGRPIDRRRGAAGAASLGTGRPGVLHGARSSILADDDGQIADAHSISAGLDYPGVGPEHAFLRDSGRAEYLPATDEEALAALHPPGRARGIIAALEPSHALARALSSTRS